MARMSNVIYMQMMIEILNKLSVAKEFSNIRFFLKIFLIA